MKRSQKYGILILGLLMLALSIEIVRDVITKDGDFIGYILVGNLTMQGGDIYNNPLINTWPPFFSVVSVPIAIIDNFNRYLVRLIWLSMTLWAMFHIVKITVKMSLGRNLFLFPLKRSGSIAESDIGMSNWIVLVPILIVFRFLLDNLSNIQINVFMLLLTVQSIYYYTKKKDMLAALVLAFSISLKVYPVFLFLYFVVKREFKIVGYVILFVVLLGMVPFIVYGYDQTIEYYVFWYNHNVLPFASVGHKNQSFFSMMRSLLTHESPGINQPLNKEIYINMLNLTIGQVKVVSYAILVSLGSVVVFVFRNKNIVRGSLKIFLEFAFILTIIPLLSPLAWKAYFIFLFPGYFINYLFVFRYKNNLSKISNLYMKSTFCFSMLTVVFSSELFIGKYYSDVLELYSCITVGTIMVAANILFFSINFNKFDRVEDL